MSIITDVTSVLGVPEPSILEIIFIASAVLGTAFFLIMMALMLVGDMLGGVVDTAFDTDFSMDSDLSFELFSLQGMAAAVMLFGYVGMFTLQSDGSDVLAVAAGGLSAVAAMYGVRSMMKAITNLQEDGTMRMENAIGQRGTVYSRIRAGEEGEVQVNVHGGLRTLAARAKDKSAHIPTGTFIEVVDLIGSILIVQELNEEE